MDFVPVSEAVELYKLTRFGEHPPLGSDGHARKRALQRAHMSGRALNADEKNALAALVSKYRQIDEMIHEVEVETRKQLGQKLFSEDVRAVVQDSRTGKLVPIPGHYWTRAKVDIIIPRLPSLRVPTINFGYSSGPVLISRDDVIKAARPASDPSANLTAEQAPFINAVSKTPIDGLAADNQPNPLHELIRSIADELNPGDKAPEQSASVLRESINKELLTRTKQRRSDSTIKAALKGTRHLKAAKRKQTKADGEGSADGQ